MINKVPRSFIALLVAACLCLQCGSHRLDALGIDGSPAAQSCERPGVSPLQQTLLGANDRSHWLQPWQAFSDTWPAKRVRNLLSLAEPDHEKGDDRWAAVYATGGVHRVLLQASWSDMQYDAPDRLNPRVHALLSASIAATVAHGMRPHIGVVAERFSPCPSVPQTLTLTAPASKGARVVQLDAASAALVVPRRTALSKLDRDLTFDAFIVSVLPNGEATLSRPLPVDLPAGPHMAATARFEPFPPPRTRGGAMNAHFEESAAGFVMFVKAVATLARQVVGSNDFDINVWPEFDRDAGVYVHSSLYDPATDTGPGDEPLVVAQGLLARVAAALAPEDGSIGPVVADGFANLLWQRTASGEPAHVGAIDRHLSMWGTWSGHETISNGSRSLDAIGRPNGMLAGDGTWKEFFAPNYHAYLPELSLTAILPPGARRQYALVRDLSPLPSSDTTGGTHVRVQRSDGAGPLAVWVAGFAAGFGTARERGFTITPQDEQHLKPKVAMRAMAAFAGTGVSLLGFYQGAPDLQLYDAQAPDGGAVFQTMARFLKPFAGPPGSFAARSLTLVSVQGCGGLQFLGDGSPAHPSLRDLDVVAFFPFQRDANSFVAAVYVMTRDVVDVANPKAAADDPARFDLPGKTYRLVIGGLGSGNYDVTAYDPMTDKSVPVAVVGLTNGEATIKLELTDTPRLVRWQPQEI